MRVTPITTPADLPDNADPALRAGVATLFSTLMPGRERPEFDANHLGLAAAAVSPALALELARMSRFLLLDLSWADRAGLRELAILVVNARHGCAFGATSRRAAATAAGLSPAQVDAAGDPTGDPASGLFDEEQREVMAFARAVLDDAVTDDLFAGMAARYGQAGTVELTTIVGFWACWAMILNTVDA